MFLRLPTLCLFFVSIVRLNAADAVPLQTQYVERVSFTKRAFQPKGDDFPSTASFTRTEQLPTITDNAPPETSVRVAPGPNRTIGVLNPAGPDKPVFLTVIDTVEETSSFAAVSPTSIDATLTDAGQATPTVTSANGDNRNEDTSEFPNDPTSTELTAEYTSMGAPDASVNATSEQFTDVTNSFGNPTPTSNGITGTETANNTNGPTGTAALQTSACQSADALETVEPQVSPNSSPVQPGATTGQTASTFLKLANGLEQMLVLFGSARTQPRPV